MCYLQIQINSQDYRDYIRFPVNILIEHTSLSSRTNENTNRLAWTRYVKDKGSSLHSGQIQYDSCTHEGVCVPPDCIHEHSSMSLKSSSSGVLHVWCPPAQTNMDLFRVPALAPHLPIMPYPSHKKFRTTSKMTIQNWKENSLISHMQVEVTLPVSKYVIHSQPLTFCQLFYILDKLAISTSISVLFIKSLLK